MAPVALRSFPAHHSGPHAQEEHREECNKALPPVRGSNMSSTPSPVVTRAEWDMANSAMVALRYGELGVVPALLDADTDHEQRVLVLTVDIPGDDEHEAPVAVLIQGGDKTTANNGLYERLTHPGVQVTLEEDTTEDSEGVA